MLDFIHEYRLWLLLALGTIFTFFALLRYQDRLKLYWLSALFLSIAHTLLGVVCVKVFAALESMDVSGFGNMSLFGAVFFLPFFYFLGARLTKRSAPLIFDAFAPCVAFVLLCSRINCILSGCCKGAQIPNTNLLYPTRELEIFFYTLLLLYFFRQDERKTTDGKYYPLYMAAYGTFRFVCEFFRSGETFWHMGHLWAAISFALGVAFLIFGSDHRKSDVTIKNL